MTGSYVELNLPEFEAAYNDPAGPVGEDLRRRGELIAKEAKQRARVDTGRMQREIALEEDHDGPELAYRVVSPAQDPDSHNFPYGYLWEQRDGYLSDSVEAGKGDSFA